MSETADGERQGLRVTIQRAAPQKPLSAHFGGLSLRGIRGAVSMRLRPSQGGVDGVRSWIGYGLKPATCADRPSLSKGLMSASSPIWRRQDPLPPRPGSAGWPPARGPPWWSVAGATSRSNTGDRTDQVSDVEVTGEPRETETVKRGSERGRWKSTRQGNSLASYSTVCIVLRRGG
jgi:hypothetical protein